MLSGSRSGLGSIIIRLTDASLGHD
jgi:hypothetical protein